VPTEKLSQHLLEQIVASVRLALVEDLGGGDLTAPLVPEKQLANATVIAKDAAILCGQPWFEQVFRQLDRGIKVDWKMTEGAAVSAGQIICEVHGNARVILTGERSALNFLQTLSATATATRAFVDAVDGTGATILDTRKTLPGLRAAQKYAVRCGGAQNHRLGLFDAILIKENHIVAAGGIQSAVEVARKQSDGVLIEVEIANLEQIDTALTSGAQRILLDNFSLADLCDAVSIRNEVSPSIGLEASGGITLDNVRDIAKTGVDFISVGSLTKDIRATDLSMRFQQID